MVVLITGGTRVSIPEGGLVIEASPEGGISGRISLHLSYDMYPHWLRISLEHALACEKAAVEVNRLWTNGSRKVEIEALEAELRSGMQACIAAAAAIDGFYGTLVELSPPPHEMREKWRENRTARYKQVSEVIKLNTKIGPKSFDEMRKHLNVMFQFRDEAVHPTARSRAPLLHPRIDVETERRLAIYTSDNAFGAAESALKIIGQLLVLPKDSMPKIEEHFINSKDSIFAISHWWEETTGRKILSSIS